MWCDRRVMSSDPKAMFGFPEVKLGLFPGWGGTVRAPRIVGLVERRRTGHQRRIDRCQGGRRDGPGHATWCPSAKLLDAAIDVIRAEQQVGAISATIASAGASRSTSATPSLGFWAPRPRPYIQQQTGGQYPAPLAALEVDARRGRRSTPTPPAPKKPKGMAGLFGSPVNRALINVFFLTDRNKKDTGVDRRDVAPRPIKSVGVIGAGIMGQGIAAANLKRDVPVDAGRCRRPRRWPRACSKILEEVSYDKETKGPDAQKAVRIRGAAERRPRPTPNWRRATW